MTTVLRPFEDMKHHPISESIVQVLLNRTQQDDALFFRLMTAYQLATMAGSMHTMIRMPEGSTVPANLYALNLGPSGMGKTRAEVVCSDEVLNQFISNFMDETLPILAEDNLPKIANKRAARNGSDPDNELTKLTAEYDRQGEPAFNFDSGSASSAKQLRYKYVMAGAGSLNLIVDEIGLHFTKNMEMLETFMEQFDGKAKLKLIKEVKDSQRAADLKGVVPTNMMMYGTPNKLLDGSKIEDELIMLLESGYARRCFFGYTNRSNVEADVTPEMYLKRAKAAASDKVLESLSDKFGRLADPINAHRELIVPDETALLMYAYKTSCESRSLELRENEEIVRIELSSRFFKTVKLAGVYAFCDGSVEITIPHLEAAIKVAEESGGALRRILKREKAWVKLARHIASLDEEVNHSELVEDLTYYPRSTSQRQELLSLAIGWGYKNNVIIKKAVRDGIEFLRGESLEKTDLNKMIVSYSTDVAKDYLAERAPFDEMHKLIQANGFHWINHHSTTGRRADDDLCPGFNFVVIDVDGECSLETAKLLLKDYKALYYTTKRHTQAENRYRILMPINFTLKLEATEFKEFMKNLFAWLPFKVDEATGQRSKKWLSHAGTYEYTDGELLDALPFIPKTKRNDEFVAHIKDQSDFDNLERWVMNNIGDGNRNQMLHRYGMMLVDNGLDYSQILSKVNSLNDKIADKLEEAEILTTIMVTVSKELAKRAP
jgi:hypothetical protein